MLERQQQQQVMMHGSDRKWTREDDKVFERALVMFPDSMPGRWVAIAAHMPGGRSDVDVWEHYKRLVHDVDLIDRGMVEMPNCWGGEGKDKEKEKAAVVVSATEQRGGGGGRGCMDDRKRGMPWTEEEHKLFLEGLVKYGKGDWRNISRWAVKTRTPTQVASHAQKYFIRQNQIANGNVRDSKRRSIHDVTNSNK